VTQYTKSLGRALVVLQAFRPERPALSLSDVAGLARIDKATVRRLLMTMQRLGFIEQDPLSRRYMLGPAILEVAAAVQVNRELRDIVRPIMFDIASRTSLSVYLAVTAGHEALCVERVESLSPIQVRVWPPGGRLPLNCGAGPRVLLAHLPSAEAAAIVRGPLGRMTVRSQTNRRTLLRDLKRIRARGWEYAVDDVTVGAAALGVPIVDRGGRVRAALSVAGLTHRFRGRARHGVLATLTDAAGRVSPGIAGE
jgi:DNA-binding IclR family transcriptional regulator